MNDIALCITVHSVASSTLRNVPKSQAFYKTLSGKHAVIIPWKNVYFNNDIYIFSIFCCICNRIVMANLLYFYQS